MGFLRFKTEREFIAKYGEKWQEKVGWSTDGGMDYLFGCQVSSRLIRAALEHETGIDLRVDLIFKEFKVTGNLKRSVFSVLPEMFTDSNSSFAKPMPISEEKKFIATTHALVSMKMLVIVSSMGDEGKGRIIGLLAEDIPGLPSYIIKLDTKFRGHEGGKKCLLSGKRIASSEADIYYARIDHLYILA